MCGSSSGRCRNVVDVEGQRRLDVEVEKQEAQLDDRKEAGLIRYRCVIMPGRMSQPSEALPLRDASQIYNNVLPVTLYIAR